MFYFIAIDITVGSIQKFWADFIHHNLTLYNSGYFIQSISQFSPNLKSINKRNIYL